MSSFSASSDVYREVKSASKNKTKLVRPGVAFRSMDDSKREVCVLAVVDSRYRSFLEFPRELAERIAANQPKKFFSQ